MVQIKTFAEYQAACLEGAVYYPGSDIEEHKAVVAQLTEYAAVGIVENPNPDISQNAIDSALKFLSLAGLIYTSFGLSGEAGEHLERVKKLIRDYNSTPTDELRQLIIKELGDVLWYIAESARQIGSSIEEVAEKNIEKLFSRRDRGVLQGDGDNR